MFSRLLLAVAIVALLASQYPVYSGSAPPFQTQYNPVTPAFKHTPPVQLAAYQIPCKPSVSTVEQASAFGNSTVVGLNSSGIASTPGVYGASVTFGEISGMPSNYTVANNSAQLRDSSGRIIAVDSQAFNTSSSGIARNFSVTLLGNLSGGPFALSILSGGTDFLLFPAGIASRPSVNPEISVYPAEQYPYGHVTVMVSGLPEIYNAGYPVIDNISVTSSFLETDMNGAGHVGINLPAIPGSNYTVRFSNYMGIDGTGNVSPFMRLTPSSGRVGDEVIALLTGFRSDSTVYITWPASHLVVGGRMNIYGRGAIAFTVPVSAYGTHQVSASSTGESTSSTFLINGSSILLSSSQGSPGMPLSVTGTGFTSGSTVHLLINDHMYGSVSSPVHSNGTSTFSMHVPAMVAGTYSFSLESSSGLVSNNTDFTVRPLLISNVTDIRFGETILISGYYFSADSSISLFWQSGIIAASASSSSNGSFSLSVRVTQLPEGPGLFGAVDARGNNATPLSLYVLPSISTNIMSGTAGQSIVLSGYGFPSGSRASILWDGNSTGVIAEANGSGSFSAVFAVPAVTPGTYIISLNSTSYGQIVFTVVQKISWMDYIPAVALPIITGAAASAWLRRRIR